MRFQFIGLAVAVVAVVSGCGLVGPTPNTVPEEAGRITIDGNAQDTESVDCVQQDFSMLIDANTAQGRAHIYLQLGGVVPVVRTVTIEGVNGVNAVAGGNVGKAEAAIDRNVYTISGTAVGADPEGPGQTRTMPFEIKAPC